MNEWIQCEFDKMLLSIYKSGWIILTLYKYVLFRFFAYFFSLKWVNKEKSVGVNYSNKKTRKKRYRFKYTYTLR